MNVLRTALRLLILVCLAVGTMPVRAQDDDSFTSGMVDIGGFSLYMKCQGEGSPTVVMVGGLGQTHQTWRSVQLKIARLTRVCVYDRAGLGRSDDSSRTPRTLMMAADELHDLLQTAAVGGPYVLAGHSLGGFIVRLYADQYPDDVAGMVLIDTAHEREADTSSFSDDELADFAQVLADQTESMTIEDWQASVDAIFATREDTTTPLEDRPLLVLATADPLIPSDITAAERERLVQEWYEYQDDLATLSSNGTVEYVEDTGHFIQDDQPDSVIEGVKQIVEAVRAAHQ